MLVAAPGGLEGAEPLALDDDALPRLERPFGTSISRGPFSVGTWIVPPSIARVTPIRAGVIRCSPWRWKRSSGRT